MGFKSLSTALLVVASLALILVLALRVKVFAAPDAIALLKTTGMTCTSCSEKISGVFAGQKGIIVTEVDIPGGWVIVGYDSKLIAPDQLAGKVVDAGFDSSLYAVLTPEEFRKAAGREIGKSASSAGGCGGCATKSGCGNK